MNMTMEAARVARRLRGMVNSSRKRFRPRVISSPPQGRYGYLMDDERLRDEERGTQTVEIPGSLDGVTAEAL